MSIFRFVRYSILGSLLLTSTIFTACSTDGTQLSITPFEDRVFSASTPQAQQQTSIVMNRKLIVPYAVSMSGGRFNLDAIGAAMLSIAISDNQYTSDLSGSISLGIASVNWHTLSRGLIHNGIFLTKDFYYLLNSKIVGFGTKKESTFQVDYDTQKITFNSSDYNKTEDLAYDSVADMASILAYIHAGILSGTIQIGEPINLVVGKQSKVEPIVIKLSSATESSLSTQRRVYDNPIFADIGLNVGGIKSFRVWYTNAVDGARPIQMNIVLRNGEVMTLIESQ